MADTAGLDRCSQDRGPDDGRLDLAARPGTLSSDGRSRDLRAGDPGRVPGLDDAPGGRAIVGDRGGPAVRELRRPAGHLLNVVGEERWWTRSGAAGRRSGRIGRSPTAAPQGSTTAAPGSPSWCSDGAVRGGRGAVHRESGHRTAAGGGDRREPGARRGGGVRRREPRPLRRRHRDRPGAGKPRRRQGFRSGLPGGGTERVSSDRGRPLCLTPSRPRSWPASATRVERHYGAPQDIEWAFDADGKLWLTQSRPITTLFPLPDAGRAGPAGVLLLQRRPGPVPADDPDGDGRVPGAHLRRRAHAGRPGVGRPA